MFSASKLYQSVSTSGTFRDLEAETDEDVFQSLPRLRDDVRVTTRGSAHDFGEIDALDLQLHRPLGTAQLGEARRQRCGDGGCALR